MGVYIPNYDGYNNWYTSSNTTAFYPTYAINPQQAPEKPKKVTAVDWLRARVEEITAGAFTEVPA